MTILLSILLFYNISQNRWEGKNYLLGRKTTISKKMQNAHCSFAHFSIMRLCIEIMLHTWCRLNISSTNFKLQLKIGSLGQTCYAYILFTKFRPKIWQSEHFLEENVALGARPWPLVELVHHGDIGSEVSNWLNRESRTCDAVHATFPVLIGGVVRLGLPIRHSLETVDVRLMDAAHLIEFVIHSLLYK